VCTRLSTTIAEAHTRNRRYSHPRAAFIAVRVVLGCDCRACPQQYEAIGPWTGGRQVDLTLDDWHDWRPGSDVSWVTLSARCIAFHTRNCLHMTRLRHTLMLPAVSLRLPPSAMLKTRCIGRYSSRSEHFALELEDMASWFHSYTLSGSTVLR